MSQTADNEIESVSGGSFESEADSKTLGSSNRGVLKSLKEDSDAFCAIKSFLIAAFVFTCAGVAVAAHFVTSSQEEADFEQSVRAIRRRSSKTLRFRSLNIQYCFSFLLVYIVRLARPKSG